MQKAIGRGRGRIVSPEVLNSVNRRPNPGSALSQIHPTSSSNPFEALFSPNVIELAVYAAISNSFTKPLLSKEEISKMIETVCDGILNDAKNASVICKYLYVATCHKLKGSIIRDAFFSHLAALWHKKDEIRKTRGLDNYRNLIWLFIMSAHHMRKPQVPPFSELLDTILDMISQLPLENDDAQVFALALHRHHEYTSMDVPPDKDIRAKLQFPIQPLVSKLKSALCKNSHFNEVSRAWLLIAYDSLTVGITKLPEEDVRFYKETIGQANYNLFASKDILKTKVPEKDTDEFNFTDVFNVILV